MTLTEEMFRYLSAFIASIYAALQVVFFLYKNFAVISSFKTKRLASFNELKSNSTDELFSSLWAQEIECENIRKAYGIRVSTLQLTAIKQLYKKLSKRFTFEQLLICSRFIRQSNDQHIIAPIVNMKKWERCLWLFCLYLTIFTLLLTAAMLITIYSYEVYKVNPVLYLYFVFLGFMFVLLTFALKKYFDYFLIKKVIKYQYIVDVVE